MLWMRKINKKISVLVLAAIILIGCETETPEYFLTEGGLKYKYQDIVGEGKEPQVGDVLSVAMKWSTIEDSVFYTSVNTGYNGADIIKLQKQNKPGGIEEGFAKLKEGDSVTFYVNPERFFKEYIQSTVPIFLIGDAEMKIDIRLIKVQNNKEYELALIEWQRLKDFEEFQKIEEVLDYWNSSGDSIVEVDGLYIVYDAVDKGEPLNYNDIFNTMKFRFKGTKPYIQEGEFNWESNTVYLGINYRFGSTQYSAKSRKNRTNDEKEGTSFL